MDHRSVSGARDRTSRTLKQYETRATFKLKSMTARVFQRLMRLQVTDLKIPTGYDLEAVDGGFEVVVRPVVFPNIRPAVPRVAGAAGRSEQGLCVITGGGGKSSV